MNKTITACFEQFNAKERFHLLNKTSGGGAFKLSEDFKYELELVLNVKIPSEYFFAMDYHLDWVLAALTQFYGQPQENAIHDNNHKLIKGTQEDVDLILVFSVSGKNHIVLFEAKGFTSWSNEQLNKKEKRLGNIFNYIEAHNVNCTNLKQHYILMSPNKPQKLTLAREEQRFGFIKLEMTSGHKYVTRVNERGLSSKKGKQWMVKNR